MWWVTSAGSKSAYFPPLEQIARTFVHTWVFASVGTDYVPTLFRFAAGYAIAAVVGVATGFALGLSDVLMRACRPIVDFMRSLPRRCIDERVGRRVSGFACDRPRRRARLIDVPFADRRRAVRLGEVDRRGAARRVPRSQEVGRPLLVRTTRS